MRKQVGLAGMNPPQPVPCSSPVRTESLVFALRPTHEAVIPRAKRAPKRCRMTPPIVTNPPGEHRVNPLGNFFYGAIVAMMQPPATHSLPHRFGRWRAHCGSDTDAYLSAAILRRSRANGVAQKIDAMLRIATPPVGILAVHDLGLVWVQCQVPLEHAVPTRLSEGLRFAPTVAEDVVRVALDGDARILPSHPAVDHRVQKPIGQQWADDRSLRRALFPFSHPSIRHAHGCLEPPLDRAPPPFAVRVPAQHSSQEFPIEGLEDTLASEITHPVIPPATLARYRQGLLR